MYNLTLINKLIFISLFTFLFLPSINFNLTNSEVFPWGIIFCIFYYRRINILDIITLLILVISYLIAWLYFTNEDGHFSIIFAYINSLFILSCLTRFPTRYGIILTKYAKRIFFLFSVIGVLQYTNLLWWANSIWVFLMTRGNTSTFGDGRGVAILASEPSRAGVELVFLYILIFGFKNKKIYHIAFLLFLIFIIKSALALSVLILFFLCCLLTKLKFKSLIYISTIILAIPILIYYSKDLLLTTNIRSISIIARLITTTNAYDAFNFLISQSGFRLISVISPYFIIFNNPFGYGVGFWEISSLKALNASSFDPSTMSYFIDNCSSVFCPVRASSYISSLLLDVGVIGSIIIVAIIFSRLKVTTYSHYYRSYLLFLFIYLFIFSEIGNPIPFVVSSIILLREKFYESNYIQLQSTK